MLDPSDKPPRTAPAEVRRKQLIEATIDTIARRGIAGTTLAEVTRRAGLSVGLANFHFRSKQTLFEETLRHLAEEHRRAWRSQLDRPGLSDAQRLLAVVEAHFRPRICGRRKLAVWFAFFGDPVWRATYRAIMAEIDTERREVSADLCARIIAANGLEGLDAGAIADTLEALYDGFWLNMLIYPGAFDRDRARREIRTFLSRTFPGCFDGCMPGPGP